MTRTEPADMTQVGRVVGGQERAATRGGRKNEEVDPVESVKNLRRRGRQGGLRGELRRLFGPSVMIPNQLILSYWFLHTVQ